MYIQQRVVFISRDGKEFEDKQECIAWEEKISARVLANWKKIPKLVYNEDELPLGGGCEDLNYVLWCRDMNDVTAANEYLSVTQGRELSTITKEDIQKRVVLTIWGPTFQGFGDGVTVRGTAEEVLENMRDKLYAAIDTWEER